VGKHGHFQYHRGIAGNGRARPSSLCAPPIPISSPILPPLYRNAVCYVQVDDAPEITVLQLPKFKAEAIELTGPDGIDAVAAYLIDHPDAGAVIPGSGGAPEVAMGGEGQREAWWGADHLPVGRDRRMHLPAPLSCEECQDRSDRGRKKAVAANRGPPERSAVTCHGKRRRGRRALERT